MTGTLVRTVLDAILLIAICSVVIQCTPLVGFEDIASGRSMPLFVYCDDVDNNFDCMLLCRRRGLGTGVCDDVRMCNCY